MSTTHPKLRQLFLHVLTNNSSFNTGHHIFLINPFYFVHSGHIYRYNCSEFFGLTHQCFSYISSSKITMISTLPLELAPRYSLLQLQSIVLPAHEWLYKRHSQPFVRTFRILVYIVPSEYGHASDLALPFLQW